MLSKNKIKQIHALSRKKIRDQENLFLAEGVKTILELIRNGLLVRSVFCLPELVRTFSGLSIDVFEVSVEEMKKISLFSTPSVALAICEKPEPEPRYYPDDNELVLALDGLQDPGNLGTIIRLCSWFGIEKLICSPDTVDCYNPKTVQSTMGALAMVKVVSIDLYDLLNQSRHQDIPVYGTFLEGENIYQQSLSHRGIIVLGNEGHGIRPEIQTFISHKLFIPSFPPEKNKIESLNVSMAASIVISEFRRIRF